jgi:hypothetical protein
MSETYLTYSNYVHSRYPEVMDLYGGHPQHFHLAGMRGTPKDVENLAIVSVFISTVSITLRFVVLKFGLVEKLRRYPNLTSWYYSEMARAS